MTGLVFVTGSSFSTKLIVLLGGILGTFYTSKDINLVSVCNIVSFTSSRGISLLWVPHVSNSFEKVNKINTSTLFPGGWSIAWPPGAHSTYGSELDPAFVFRNLRARSNIPEQLLMNFLTLPGQKNSRTRIKTSARAASLKMF